MYIHICVYACYMCVAITCIISIVTIIMISICSGELNYNESLSTVFVVYSSIRYYYYAWLLYIISSIVMICILFCPVGI